jgi:hypothetical protein
MVPYRTRQALRNLRSGIKKTEDNLNAAARVRRAFKAGRPIKKDQMLNGLSGLAIATQQLKELRAAMEQAGLNPKHAVAWLVLTHPVTGPERLLVTPSRVEERFALLAHPDTTSLGVAFGQYDESLGEKFFWEKYFRMDVESRKVVVAAILAARKEAGLSNWN